MKEEKLRSFRNIAKLIKAKRLNHPKHYSQSELSQMLGYKNGQFISNVERSLCSIPLKMLTKVARILDIAHEEIRDALLKDHHETIVNYLQSNEDLSEDSVSFGEQRQNGNSTTQPY